MDAGTNENGGLFDLGRRKEGSKSGNGGDTTDSDADDIEDGIPDYGHCGDGSCVSGIEMRKVRRGSDRKRA